MEDFYTNFHFWVLIQGPLHAWFTDYLISRSQRVVIDSVFSPWVPVTSGVPQWSIVGPLLFLLYISDLPNVPSPSTSIALFADDAKCYRVVRNAEDYSSLQHDLSSVYDWSKDWSLSYNTNKCEVLRISRKRRSLLNLSTVYPYSIDGHPLALVSSTKNLEVIVNNKLTWSLHISSVVAKANKTLGFLNGQFSFPFIGPSHRK